MDEIAGDERWAVLRPLVHTDDPLDADAVRRGLAGAMLGEAAGSPVWRVLVQASVERCAARSGAAVIMREPDEGPTGVPSRGSVRFDLPVLLDASAEHVRVWRESFLPEREALAEAVMSVIEGRGPAGLADASAALLRAFSRDRGLLDFVDPERGRRPRPVMAACRVTTQPADGTLRRACAVLARFEKSRTAGAVAGAIVAERTFVRMTCRELPWQI